MDVQALSSEARQVLAGFEAFSRGDWEAVLPFLVPDTKWEENQAMGFPGLDPVYVGPDGFRKWMKDTREAWDAIRSEVDDLTEVQTSDTPSYVVTTRLRGSGRQAIEVDMLLYNVIWSRPGPVLARRRIYFDRAEALAEAARTDSEIEAESGG